MSMADAATITAANRSAEGIFRAKRLRAFAIPALVLAYFAYIFFAFDIPGLADRASLKNARILVSDSYSYKTHVTRDNRSGDVTVVIEGERKGDYGANWPNWVQPQGDAPAVINLGSGRQVTFGQEIISYDVPGYGLITAEPGRGGVQAQLPGEEVPDWINISKNRMTVKTEAGRLTVTRNKTTVFRYFGGWELFFFTLDSPYHGLSPREVAGRAFAGEAGQIFHEFWHNRMWRHGDVAWAIFETILMAFLGTFGSAILALPLAFLAARNFAPLGALRFAARRFFDFLRGVDALIWTIVLSRAFGPGPLTGALAILITDTGSFGKLFSEALENVDEKQIEGVRSTGARPLQRYRFGVIPQITPVLLSQVLYFLESNTRSATIIGAITGGGIGLLLTQAMITQKDWEEVSYYIILVILMVMLMDWISGILRRRLISGGGAEEL